MPLEPGSAAPSSAVQAADAPGGSFPLERLWRDGPALLFVYKADCPASELGADALPSFAGLPGLTVAALGQEEPATAVDFAGAHGWAGRVTGLVEAAPWPASEALQVLVTPTWLLVERGGRLAQACEGWSRADAAGLAVRAAALCGAPGAAPAIPEVGAPFRPG